MAKKKQETLVLFSDILTGTRRLSDAQFGALMRGIFAYRFEDMQQEFEDPMVDMAFGFVKTQLDRYKEVCEINRRNRTNKPLADAEEVEENEEQRNTTKGNETKGKDTHTHNHNHNHTRNHTHNHTHNHSHNHNHIALAAEPSTPIIPTEQPYFTDLVVADDST